MRFRLGRSDGVTISLQAKKPGRRIVSRPVDLAVDFDGVLGHRRDAYERLLDDVMDGQQQRFARPETIEREWRIVTPILDLPSAPLPYESGTWGPSFPTAQAAQRWYEVGPGHNDTASSVPPTHIAV